MIVILLGQRSRDARSGSIDLHKFEREIQVNVTINSNLLFERAPFYHFYSGLRKRKKRVTVLTDFHQIFTV